MALASPSQPGMLPDPDSCWTAVQRRDRAYNGRFWFSVQSTGVYCLPSCAARPPLRKNVAFHVQPGGELGYFQTRFKVYDRAGARCPTAECGHLVRRLVQSGRSTFYCARCQR